MRRRISNVCMTVIIRTNITQMQSDPKYCGGEIFHKHIDGLQINRICLGRCCHGTFRNFSQEMAE